MATTPLIRNAWTEQDLYAMLYSLGLSSREERHLATICGDALVDIVKRRGGSTLFPEQSEKLDELRRCILLSAMGPFVALDKYWPADEAKKARFYEAVYTIWFLYGLDGTSGGDGADRHFIEAWFKANLPSAQQTLTELVTSVWRSGGAQ